MGGANLARLAHLLRRFAGVNSYVEVLRRWSWAILVGSLTSRARPRRASVQITQPGLVADLCCGSGTTAVAAIQEGCRWIGFEVQEDTYPIATKRIAAAVGATPCPSTGQHGRIPFGESLLGKFPNS